MPGSHSSYGHLLCQILRLRGRLNKRLALKQIVAVEGEGPGSPWWERIEVTVEVFLDTYAKLVLGNAPNPTARRKAAAAPRHSAEIIELVFGVLPQLVVKGSDGDTQDRRGLRLVSIGGRQGGKDMTPLNLRHGKAGN